MTEQERLHVVLGAGPLGLAVARHLAAKGERVRVANQGGRADYRKVLKSWPRTWRKRSARDGRATRRPSFTTAPTRPTPGGPSCTPR